MKGHERGGSIFRFLGFLFFLGLLGALYLVRHPLLRMAGNFWVTEDSPQHADAILVIGDDNFAGDRAARAAELYRAGWAPQVVASGRRLRPYAGVAELIAHDLESHGVPSKDIVRFDQDATDTREEAQALRGLTGEKHWSRVLLVTSNYHTRRARYIFRKAFPPETSVTVIAAADPSYDPNSWWEARAGLEIFFLESVAYCVARWES